MHFSPNGSANKMAESFVWHCSQIDALVTCWNISSFDCFGANLKIACEMCCVCHVLHFFCCVNVLTQSHAAVLASPKFFICSPCCQHSTMQPHVRPEYCQPCQAARRTPGARKADVPVHTAQVFLLIALVPVVRRHGAEDCNAITTAVPAPSPFPDLPKPPPWLTKPICLLLFSTPAVLRAAMGARPTEPCH